MSGQQESQITNNSGTLLNHRRGITGGTRSSTTVDEKTTIEALQLPTTFGAAPPQVPDLRTVRGTDPSMSQSGFTYFDRTSTTFMPVFKRTPPSNVVATLPIGSSLLTSFTQMLCGELLGPTSLCSRFTTSALLGFLQTLEPHLQEGFRVDASSTPFRNVLALACTATTGHCVFPTH